MGFLFPWAAGFAALIPVVIALYLLRQRRRRIVVPSITRWRASHEPAPSRMAWGRVRSWRSLLLNLLILILILLALLRPEFSSWLKPEPTIVVLDSRLRMQATGADGSSAFERARATASGLAAQASEARPISILTTEGVGSPLTADARRAAEAVGAAQLTDAGGDPGLDKLAVDGRRIIFITDRPTEIDGVEVIAVGEPGGNVAVTDFALRELPDGGQSRALFVRVRNFTDAATERDLELRLDDQLLDVIPIKIPPGESLETLRTFSARELESERGWLTGRLVGPDDSLASDDIGRAAVPVGGKPRVLLVSLGNWFLENALSADPGIAFELLTPESWQPGMETAFDVVVLDDWMPVGMTVADAAAGNFLFVGRNPWSTNESEIDGPVITETDDESPLLAGLSLEGAVISRSAKVDGLQPVVRSVDDVLIGVAGATAEAATRQAVIAFRPGESDLPLRVAFPLLMSNAVRWLAAIEPTTTTLAGESFTLDGYSRVFSEAGFPQLGEAKWLAVNPASRGESDVLLAATSAPDSPISGSIGGWVPWRLLVVLALVAVAFEWFAFHRWRVR